MVNMASVDAYVARVSVLFIFRACVASEDLTKLLKQYIK